MDRGDGPKPAYSAVIGKLILNGSVTAAEIAKLPDPDLFTDALTLAYHGTWTPSELDATDTLLLALVDRLRNTRRKGGRS